LSIISPGSVFCHYSYYPKKQSSDKIPFTIKVFEANNGWQNSVLIRNYEIIRQKTIPAIQQQSAFLNQKNAYELLF